MNTALMMGTMLVMGGMMGMRLRRYLDRRVSSGSPPVLGAATAIVRVEDRPYRVGDPPPEDVQASPCNCCPRVRSTPARSAAPR